jgi:biotin transporter BioY
MTRSRLLAPVPLSLILGTFSGAALIAVHDNTRRGYWMLYAYMALAMVIGLCVHRLEQTSFRVRFSFSLIAFMTATVLLAGYLILFDNPKMLHAGLWPVLWPQLVMLAIGATISLWLAAITATRASA